MGPPTGYTWSVGEDVKIQVDEIPASEYLYDCGPRQYENEYDGKVIKVLHGQGKVTVQYMAEETLWMESNRLAKVYVPRPKVKLTEAEQRAKLLREYGIRYVNGRWLDDDGYTRRK